METHITLKVRSSVAAGPFETIDSGAGWEGERLLEPMIYRDISLTCNVCCKTIKWYQINTDSR